MRTDPQVTMERRVAAPPETVWAIVADPRRLAGLDDRVRLLSTTGTAGEVGSSYVMAVRGREARVVVVSAEPGVRLARENWVGSALTGVQHGELLRDGEETVLRWTVDLRVGRLLRGLAVANARRELPRWLAAVERAAGAERRPV